MSKLNEWMNEWSDWWNYLLLSKEGASKEKENKGVHSDTQPLVKKGTESSPLNGKGHKVADKGLLPTKWLERKDSGKDWEAFVQRPSVPSPSLYRINAEVRWRPNSLRMRYSIRGPDTTVRKPDIMSQEGLLNACPCRGTAEWGLPFTRCEGRVLKKTISPHSQSSYTKYGVLARGGRRRDGTTSTKPPTCPPLTQGEQIAKVSGDLALDQERHWFCPVLLHLPCTRGPSSPRVITVSSIHRR